MVAGNPPGDAAKRDRSRASIGPGCILRVFCDFIENPKLKFVVVLHVNNDEGLILVFIVNSEIPPFIEHDAHLRAGQILLEQNVYKFFTHDSFLNCTEVHYELDIDFAVDHLIETPGDHKGELRDAEKQKIIDSVRSAQTITDEDKAIIIKSLQSVCNQKAS